MHTEFKQFDQSVLKGLSHIPKYNLSCLKTKLQDTCKKYSKGHAPYKY